MKPQVQPHSSTPFGMPLRLPIAEIDVPAVWAFGMAAGEGGHAR
jgi:hypothetical protein